MYVLYSFAKPVLTLLIYVSTAPDTPLATRLPISVVCMACFCVMFALNLICAAVTSAAHRPRKVLYKALMDVSIPLQFRLKIYSFLEHTTDRHIGFWCYDLFPMNNYEFYQYVCSWAYQYFLTITLLKNSHLI